MRIRIEWDFDLDHDHPDYGELHNKFAAENGVPLEVDLNEYFEDPSKVSNYHVTDALSDEHGWLVYDWYVITEKSSNLNKSVMTVKDLIEALSKYHPTNKVVIEVNHDELLTIDPSHIELAMITPDYRLAYDEDTDAESVTIIRL